MSEVERRLTEAGLRLPPAAASVANYVPAVRVGDLIFISGQICFGEGGTIAPAHRGKLGATVSEADGRAAAEVVGLNLLAQLKLAVGDLDRVARCVRVCGYINAVPDYAALPQVMNGASDLMVLAFGEAGRHARTTVGVAQLPLDSAVEVEAIFALA
jgi:enamine deaminase RidA (YjgF/YER057c/UK114 family)